MIVVAWPSSACCGWCPADRTGWCAALGNQRADSGGSGGSGWLRGTVFSGAMRRSADNEITTLSNQLSGFILRPGATRVLCAHVGVESSNLRRCDGSAGGECVPGCTATAPWMPPSTSLREALREATRDGATPGKQLLPRRHALEVVLDATPLLADPAGAVEAIWFVATCQPCEEFAREAHRAFLEEYGLATNPPAVPLLVFFPSFPYAHSAPFDEVRNGVDD